VLRHHGAAHAGNGGGSGRSRPPRAHPAVRGLTDLFILPGFAFRAADLLLTNFHLPRSTLLMLAAPSAGTRRMRAAYAHAVTQGYRFFSYGDASLLHRHETDLPA
jgi:S-adenosylmethionine:tRNA ribosyltransferase-isomerase